MKRRDFLKTGARSLILGGLALTGAVLGLRSRSADPGAPSCPAGLSCRSCGRFDGCSEPRAVRVRSAAAPPAPNADSHPAERSRHAQR